MSVHAAFRGGRSTPATGQPAATPTGIALAAGAVGLIVAGLIASAVPVSNPGWRFAVMAIAVGVFAAISMDQRALAAIAVLAFGITDGFLEDRAGQLAWHGAGDLWRILALVMAAASGLAAGEAYRMLRDLRPRDRMLRDLRSRDRRPHDQRPRDRMPFASARHRHIKEEEHRA